MMVAIHPSTDRDHTEIVAIGNGINPDWMARSVEDFRAAIRSQPPAASAQSYVAEAGGKVVGHLWRNRLIYVPNPHVWYADIQVPPGARGQGIGSRLYEFLLDRLTDHQAQLVHAHVREDLPVARRFVRRRGFRETGHGDRPSRLEVSSANTEPGRQAAERLEREGIRISTLEELSGDGEEVLHGIHELVNETYADIPSSEEWTSIPFGEWQRLRTEAEERSDMVWVAVEDGRVVGVGTLLQRQNTLPARDIPVWRERTAAGASPARSSTIKSPGRGDTVSPTSLRRTTWRIPPCCASTRIWATGRCR